MPRLTRRHFMASSVLAAAWTAFSPAVLAQSATPWRNWSGGLSANPAGRFAPSSEDELIEFLKSTAGKLRPVGSGHSFSPLVPTDGHLIVIDQLSGILAHDPDAMQTTVGAGSRLGDLGPALDQAGQAMMNLPDIDRQTLAGATATGTHGTGVRFTNLSGYVRDMRLITPAGQVIEVNEASDSDLFNAARVSLGALGVVTRMTLQNRSPFRLKARTWMQETEEVLENFDTSAAAHRHFEMFPLTHSDYASVLAIDETDEPVNNPVAEDDGSAGAFAALALLPPGMRRPIINGIAALSQPSEFVDQSWKVLTNIRNSRFNEMEYSVPIEAGADCLREVLKTIADKKIDVVFPLEYRYVAPDDIWLSMSYGDHGHAAISIHRMASEDYRPYFNEIEPIFWKYGGRPHWGKVHSLGYRQLKELYPHFQDFADMRAEMDPEGRLLNDHLSHIFGVAS